MDEHITLPEPDHEWHARHNLDARRPLPWKRIIAVLIALFIFLCVGLAGGLLGFVTLANNDSPWAQKVRDAFGLTDLAELRIPIRQDLRLDESSAVIDAAKKVSPAVVSVTASAEVMDFFGRTSSQEISGGSGFIITSDGLILTNKHVVEQQANYKVVLSDGRIFDAVVKAIDPLNDLAVLKIDAKDLPTVEIGKSEELKIGQYVLAVGNALGEFDNSVTLGVVSAKDRNLQDVGTSGESLTDLIQTDAAINPGNSGGPLVNMAGQVVGINTAIASNTGGSIGLGFAISIDSIKSVIDSVIKSGEIIRPYIGVRYIPVTKTLQELNNLTVDYGALVKGSGLQLGVLGGSPAEKAGILENDILLEINSERIDEDSPLAKRLQKYKVGETVQVKLLRGGQEQTVAVTLEKLPAQ